MNELLNALPQVAKSPLAFVAYLVVVVAWVVISVKVVRNWNLLRRLGLLPEKDRLRALESEMGTVRIKGGISAEQWLRSRVHYYLLVAFAIAVLAVTVVLLVALLSPPRTPTLVPASQRAYIRFSDLESPYAPQFLPNAGWRLNMNVTLTNTGTTQADLLRAYGNVYLRNDAGIDNQRDVVTKFVENTWKSSKSVGVTTLNPTDKKYITAQGEREQLRLEDVQGFPGRLEVIFVVSEAEFKDESGLHQSRFCVWGMIDKQVAWIDQPPISVWVGCKVFNNDD